MAHIGISEQEFEQNAVSLEGAQATQSFIAGSRESLNHLRLAALAQIREALERALRINGALLALRFGASDPFRIAEAYRIWSERQSDSEDVRPEIFAEQVAYVFFVRLLLVRVLEDKHILQPRLASDGGFLDWSTYVKRHFRELDGIGILNENYYNILSRKAGLYYLHFFQQAIFDWFSPDDFLLVETLDFLCNYNFQHVTSDIIGFTYEEYIERTARNRKGHFLTRQDVVEYMLDLLDYSGPQVIGRRILDPACGSGSFLVHAARRYRQSLVTYFRNTHGLTKDEDVYTHADLRKELARRYIDDLTSLFYGMELNPFACYLAEMNLLIQGLDDLFVLQQSGDSRPVERFHIYNTDSLDLPREVLESEDVTAYSVLPQSPSGWARTAHDKDSQSVARISLVLEQLKKIRGKERGIVLRQVARLNTREHLIASWFERKSDFPIAFTNELWRMVLKSGTTEQNAKAILAILNSKIMAYLINLFSTNNHVSKDELDRLPIPDPQTLPVTQLADLANQLLDTRASLERDFVIKYGAQLPEFDDGSVYVPPSGVLATLRAPKLTMAALVGCGEVQNIGPANGRIRALRARNAIVCTMPASNPNAAIFAQVLALFLNEPKHENQTWSEAQNWQLPDPIAASAWLNAYNTAHQQAQSQWHHFVELQRQVDEVVADWYGFDAAMRTAIAEGLPWARRRR